MKDQVKLSAWWLLLGFCVVVFWTSTATAQTSDDDESHEASQSAIRERALVQQLTNRDARVRQQAAEGLARLALPDERKLVEGFRLQEKDSRVRIALDWALYRMGKLEALFGIVRALDSSASNQAVAYLNELESPQPLYVFLRSANRKTQTRLLEVLARIGDASTLGLVKAYVASGDPKIAAVAQNAERTISNRLAQPEASAPTRPRQVGTKDEAEP